MSTLQISASIAVLLVAVVWGFNQLEPIWYNHNKSDAIKECAKQFDRGDIAASDRSKEFDICMKKLGY